MATARQAEVARLEPLAERQHLLLLIRQPGLVIGDLPVEILDVHLGPRQDFDVVLDRRLEVGDLLPRPVDLELDGDRPLGVVAELAERRPDVARGVRAEGQVQGPGAQRRPQDRFLDH